MNDKWNKTNDKNKAKQNKKSEPFGSRFCMSEFD